MEKWIVVQIKFKSTSLYMAQKKEKTFFKYSETTTKSNKEVAHVIDKQMKFWKVFVISFLFYSLR